MVQAFFRKEKLLTCLWAACLELNGGGEREEMERMKLYNEMKFPRMQEEMGPKI